jgi:alkylhydroperoxidase family enzyme
LLNAREKAAIHYAEVLAGDLQGADEALFSELRAQFTEEEIVDLGIRIMTFVGYGRLVRVLGLEIGGVCPLPPRGS